MDFKKLIGKLDSIEAPVAGIPAPTLPAAVQLNEDSQLRVLSGVSTILAESAIKPVAAIKPTANDSKPKSDAKKDSAKKGGKAFGDELKKAKDKANETAEPLDEEDELEESAAQDAAREKFKAKVAKKKDAKPDPTTNERPKKPESTSDKTKNLKVQQKKASTTKKPADTKAKKDPAPKWLPNAKKAVKESIERKLSFKDMIKLVQESGGQQQIDPVDAELFDWAQRVAVAKFNESAKQEVYAGMVYERMGGEFRMFDVLSEAAGDDAQDNDAKKWAGYPSLPGHPDTWSDPRDDGPDLDDAPIDDYTQQQFDTDFYDNAWWMFDESEEFFNLVHAVGKGDTNSLKQLSNVIQHLYGTALDAYAKSNPLKPESDY